MSPTDGPVEFVLMANLACWGTAALLVSLFILAGVVIRWMEAASNRSVDLETGAGTDGQRA
jgi:hypothetical protein